MACLPFLDCSVGKFKRCISSSFTRSFTFTVPLVDPASRKKTGGEAETTGAEKEQQITDDVTQPEAGGSAVEEPQRREPSSQDPIPPRNPSDNFPPKGTAEKSTSGEESESVKSA